MVRNSWWTSKYQGRWGRVRTYIFKRGDRYVQRLAGRYRARRARRAADPLGAKDARWSVSGATATTVLPPIIACLLRGKVATGADRPKLAALGLIVDGPSSTLSSPPRRSTADNGKAPATPLPRNHWLEAQDPGRAYHAGRRARKRSVNASSNQRCDVAHHKC